MKKREKRRKTMRVDVFLFFFFLTTEAQIRESTTDQVNISGIPRETSNESRGLRVCFTQHRAIKRILRLRTLESSRWNTTHEEENAS